MNVRPKKALGQHFLTDTITAERIVQSLQAENGNVLEIGPGMGVLTQFLLKRDLMLKIVDVDAESIEYLRNKYNDLKDEDIFHADFLKTQPTRFFDGQFSVIGNFPYNISSQIFFAIYEFIDQVDEIVCMLQKEVAMRIASPPGNKTYGILSVLLQAFYDIDYLFTVKPGQFFPPPKVQSGVIRLSRNNRDANEIDQKKLKEVVKTAFNQRRKIMNNSLKKYNPQASEIQKYLSSRPEQLSAEDFIYLSRFI